MARARKPHVFPGVVLIDTREQSPLPFQNIDDWDEIPTAYVALRTGDYSLKGHESRVAIERKSVADFYGSIGADRDRFKREMERLSEFDYAAVVIEGDPRFEKSETCQMPAKTATHTMLSWSIRYGVHFWPCINRRHAELTTFHLLRHWLRQELERVAAAEKCSIQKDLDDAIDSAIATP